jgi:hypothetical protein
MSMPGTAPAQATASEPPRIKRFRRELIAAIPRFPNTRASLSHMQQKGLPELLIDYTNWRSRYVGQRPRTITVEAAAQNDPRWSSHAAAIKSFLDKVKRGDDLTPHLSIEPHTRGYAPAARAPSATSDNRWSDKDFLLNIMGFHHFHLGTTKQKRGYVDRTNDLIFAEVGRDTFKVIAIFDHDVFEQNSIERTRLWALHQTIVFRDVAPESVVVMGNTAASCHSIHVVLYASCCAVIIRDLEPKLDDLNYMATLYPQGQPMSPKPKFSSDFIHLDLAIYDAAKLEYLVLQKGWN